MARNLISSDTVLRGIKTGDPRRRVSDGDGLFLLLFVRGGAHGWRLDYTIKGKRKTLSLGTYPDTGIKLAREKADAARRHVAAGIDPSDVRKSIKTQSAAARDAEQRVAAGLPAAGSFEAVAREWHAKMASGWAPSHADTTIRRLEKDVFPLIGAGPIADVTAPVLLAVLRLIEGRGATETADRVRTIAGQVFRYAIATGRAERDWAADLRGTLQTHTGGHHAAITDPAQFGELVRAMRCYRGSNVVRTAMQISALVFQRPGEVRSMTWSEVDLDAGLWTIPAARMKRSVRDKANGDPHVVPLSRQAVKLLRELHPFTGRHGDKGFVFPGERGQGRPLSENGVRMALRTLGYGNDAHTPHGFRASARTMLDEVLGVRVDVIEAQLAHAVRDPLGRAYNRTTFLAERIKMMQAWADYLDKLAAGADVLLFKRVA